MKVTATFPTDHAQAALARIEAVADPALFITRVPPEAVRARAAQLVEEGPRDRPLWGRTFVVKDNIDAAGLPTTAACPDASTTPEADSPAVARLLAAGAILLGKVNLDQFATGLVGVRSPHGTPRNMVVPTHVPGGSSSGSASAVAAGIADFSLGTDTAGSGRIPAGAQELVGFKPSLGLVPTRGVVPACRSLDCVSVFARGIEDAATVLEVIAGADADDPYSRAAPRGWSARGTAPPHVTLAVPEDAQLIFDTPDDAARFAAAIARFQALGARVVRVDIAPLLAVARRLYDGAWVAERTEALLDRVCRAPDTLHPVTRSILEGGLARRTVDAFADFHQAAQARLHARRIMAGAAVLLLPTYPGLPTLEALAADPIGANSRLGTYTNFVNLCDLSALAIPNGRRADGVPCGITLVGAAFAEGTLAGLAAAFTNEPLDAPPRPDEVELFCIGAHMSGLPLNGQVLGHGGRFVRAATTAPEYRLFDMGNRPGMLRVAEGGVAITGEIWALPSASIGPFLAEIPPPLGFARVRLADGATPLGFIAEPAGVAGLPDISASGGWRAHLATRSGA
ncbi:MAG: allophanate hydrolase [Alphaproteobacteria bacterium]|nr:allophanate hydrolase [Alphaproteobacteria bacterium]